MTEYAMVPLHMVTELIAMLAVGSDDQIQEAALVAVRAAKPASTAQHDEEPVAWEFQHEETGLIDFVDPQQVEWGFEKNNPRWQKIGPVYRHPSPAVAPPADDIAVDRFAEAMKAKLAKKRDEGRGGWETCPGDMLSKMLIDHIAKGDPVDVANFCMMLHQNGARIRMPEQDQEQVDIFGGAA